MNPLTREAHELLDAARDGVPISDTAITRALMQTGDLLPLLHGSEMLLAQRMERQAARQDSRAPAHLPLTKVHAEV